MGLPLVLGSLISGLASGLGSHSRNSAIGDANAFAQSGVFQGGRFRGPSGINAGLNFGTDGRANINSGVGRFKGPLGDLFKQAGSFLGPDGNPENAFMQALLSQLGAGSIGDLDAASGSLDRSLSNRSDFDALGESFNRDIAFAGQDPFALGSQISDRFRPGLERSQNTLRNNTFDNLFNRGSSAVSSAASPILEGLQTTLGEQNIALDDFGLQRGEGMINNAFGRALGASGQREAIGSRNFGESFSSAQLLSNNALNKFGIGQGMFDSFLRNQGQQQDLGLRAVQGASGISQLPLSFLQAIMGAGGLRSDSILGGAGVMAQNANNVSNPFADALLSGGSFFANAGG